MHAPVDPRRIRQLNTAEQGSGPVLWWISRDQRLEDNWASLHAFEIANKQGVPVIAVFCLVTSFLGAALRQYDFMLKGLAELEAVLNTHGVPLVVLSGGEPVDVLAQFADSTGAACVVTDFSPLRIGRRWREQAAKQLTVPLYEVDAHNIVPAWVTSQKQEFAARTIRPKIHKQLSEFLVDFPPLPKLSNARVSDQHNDWSGFLAQLHVDESVPPVDWCVPGSKAGTQALKDFLSNRFASYASLRNDPNEEGQSNLSPYLHFGQLSAQRVALAVLDHVGKPVHEVMAADRNGSATESAAAAFLEEVIVRRELSDNFCLYNPHYDSPEGFADWAKKTLAEHAADPRQYRYSLQQLDQGQTHEQLWNAAQLQMVKCGKMHGYLRMYWAKKLLEWSVSPDEAMRTAIYLNDRYSLDGRDPNGYAGIAWSIGGVHDRAWFKREVYGSIRYMSDTGAAAKFKTKDFIQQWTT